MKYDRAFVKQPAGMGDIIFGCKIAAKLLDKCKQVIWPVSPVFDWLDESLLRDKRITYPNIDKHFPDKDQFQYLDSRYSNEFSVIESPNSNDIYVPLQSADRGRYDISVMYSKYKMLNLDFDDWAMYFNFSIRKDLELYNHIIKKYDLGNRDYIVVNRHYGSPPNMNVCSHIRIDTDMKVVEMEPIPGYTMFDWKLVLEEAEQIHTAETSLPYLIEKIDCKGLNMYSKHTPPHYNHVRKIFKENWVWHM